MKAMSVPYANSARDRLSSDRKRQRDKTLGLSQMTECRDETDGSCRVRAIWKVLSAAKRCVGFRRRPRPFVLISGLAMVSWSAACSPDMQQASHENVAASLAGCVSSMGQWRNTVALTQFSASKSAFCSGVVVGNKRILTAKHCLEGAPYGSIDVVFHPDLNSARAEHRKRVLGTAVHPKSDVAVLFTEGVCRGKAATDKPYGPQKMCGLKRVLRCVFLAMVTSV